MQVKEETEELTEAEKKAEREQEPLKVVEKKKTDIDAQIKLLRKEKDEIYVKKGIQEKQRKIVNFITTQIVEENKLPEEVHALSVTDKNFKSIDRLVEYYGDTCGRFDVCINNVEMRKKNIDDDIRNLENQKNALKLPDQKERRKFQLRQVSITVDATKESECEVLLSYMVEKTSWKPSYDFRVFPGKKSLEIHFFALINQKTGEEWKNAKLSLTTAQPKLEGDDKELPTVKPLKVAIKPQEKEKNEMKCRKMSLLDRPPDSPNYMSLKGLNYEGAFGEKEIYEAPKPKMKVATAQVRAPSGPGFNVNFDIERRSSIPSDEIDHKVTAGIVNLKPEFIYETVPSLSPNVYHQEQT